MRIFSALGDFAAYKINLAFANYFIILTTDEVIRFHIIGCCFITFYSMYDSWKQSRF